jgi:hypothetical protein
MKVWWFAKADDMPGHTGEQVLVVRPRLGSDAILTGFAGLVPLDDLGVGLKQAQRPGLD